MNKIRLTVLGLAFNILSGGTFFLVFGILEKLSYLDKVHKKLHSMHAEKEKAVMGDKTWSR